MNIIICFHVVNDMNWFERTILTLKKYFQLINIQQLEQHYSNKIKLNNTCHITVDDGDISFYNNIYPILVKHQVPATLFVSPLICRDSINFWFQDAEDLKKEVFVKQVKNRVGSINSSIERMSDIMYVLKCFPIKEILSIIESSKSSDNNNRSRNINLSQLIEISKSNLVEIGAHTLHHPILKNEDDITSDHEISQSINLLETFLEKKIKYFAFPNGIPNIDYSDREIVFLRKNNINLAFSTEPRILSIKDNPLSLPRLSISHGSMNFIKLKIYLFRYWNIISFFWHPAIKQRKKFIEAVKKS